MKVIEKNVYTMYHSGMKIHIKRWGNSLALRIPNTVAKEMKIESGNELDLQIQDDKIVISKPKYTLEELLSNLTPDMIEGEIDWGPPVGKEIW